MVSTDVVNIGEREHIHIRCGPQRQSEILSGNSKPASRTPKDYRDPERLLRRIVLFYDLILSFANSTAHTPPLAQKKVQKNIDHVYENFLHVTVNWLLIRTRLIEK